jgi:hypothetical protein
MKKILYIFITVLIVNTGCEKIFMSPNPGTSNIDVFNEYANLVREKFAMLEYKGVDIDHLQDSIGTTITENMTEEELFSKLTIITDKLRDAHSDIGYGDTLFIYPFYEGYPLALDRQILLDNYIGDEIAPGITWLHDDIYDATKAIYGHLPQSQDIGYLRIGSWMYPFTDEEIETIFKTFKNDKGLIFDLRENTGGDPVMATKFASYLTDKDLYIGYEHFKTGPGKNDFADSKLYLKTSGSENIFTKPVMVLTDVFCFSATTTFMYSVNTLDNVKFVGQKSGGGAGSVADGFLANGWHWDLSVSEFIDLNGNHWDEGHEPDYHVALDTTDRSKDEILEFALSKIDEITQ